MVIVDADEIWDPATLKKSITIVAARPEKMVRVRFAHFWKSFYWYCIDPCMPTRLINLHGENEWYLLPQDFPVFHFGYCQSDASVLYKQDIHGHKNEWRKDWFAKKYMGWTPGITDVHPTCEQDFWHPRKTSPEHYAKVDELLYDHPRRIVEI
jgi:hypothetical protein